MLGPQGKLVVKELGLDRNLEGRPGLAAGKREGMGFATGAQQQRGRPAHSAAWAVEEGRALFHPVSC